jgi:hypothetical protein
VVMAEVLGKAKVNILAFMTDEAEGRLVTNNPAKAGKTVTVSICDSQKKRCHPSQQARNIGRSSG